MLNYRKYPQPLIFRDVKTRLLELFLRIGASCTFFGHGMLALNVNPKWIEHITVFGFADQTAQSLLIVIGCMDLLMTLALLFYPIRAVIIWAVIWPLAASLTYPIVGEPIWEFIERASNWFMPLVLLCMVGVPKTWRELWSMKKKMPIEVYKIKFIKKPFREKRHPTYWKN
jgi:hypothetical protein